MSEQHVKPVDLNKGANLIYHEVKRKLEDTKTVVFIVLSAINIFLWGLVLSAKNDTSDDIQNMIDKEEVTQIMIHNLETKVKLLEEKLNDSSSM